LLGRTEAWDRSIIQLVVEVVRCGGVWNQLAGRGQGSEQAGSFIISTYVEKGRNNADRIKGNRLLP
jgi:hypothetical protein